MTVTMAHSSNETDRRIFRLAADSKALDNGVTSIPGTSAGKRERLDRKNARPLPLPSADSNGQIQTGGAVGQEKPPDAGGFSEGQAGEGKKQKSPR